MPEKAIRVLWIYALSILLISTKANPAAADRILEPSPKKLSFGNLKKLTFKGGNGEYTLNGFVLSKVDSETINLATANNAFRVRVTLLSTVLVSQSRAVNASHQAFCAGLGEAHSTGCWHPQKARFNRINQASGL
jgi:hypothetical protein